MALKVTVKVGNIVNLSDARYCAGMGVDLIGFPSTLALTTYRDIRGWVTGPRVVLELDPEFNGDASELIDSFVPDFVMAVPGQAARIPSSVPLILSFHSDDLADLPETLLKRADYFQFRVGNASDLLAVDRLRLVAPVLVDCSEPKYRQAVLMKENCGIALYGSAEEKPGLKDFDTLSEILEELEISEE